MGGERCRVRFCLRARPGWSRAAIDQCETFAPGDDVHHRETARTAPTVTILFSVLSTALAIFLGISTAGRQEKLMVTEKE